MESLHKMIIQAMRIEHLEHLDLLMFNSTSEIELEEWFVDAAFKIMANEATASTTLKVMQLLAPPQLRAVLNSYIPLLQKMVYIEDLLSRL